MAKTASVKHAGKAPKTPSMRKQLGLAHSPGRLHSAISSKYNVRMSPGARYALACVLDFALKEMITMAKTRAVKKQYVKNPNGNKHDKVYVPRRMTPTDIRVARDDDADEFLSKAFEGSIPQTGFEKSLVKTGKMKLLERKALEREERANAKEKSRKERKRKADKAKADE